jgi:hypothetical protein
MSLLHQESPQDIDDAARGEEFTRGTTHMVWAGAIAAVLVTVALALYVLSTGKSRPWSAERLFRSGLIPNHVVTSGIDANGESMAKESFDQVLVFAHVKLHNQSKSPLVLAGCAGQCQPGRRHPFRLRRKLGIQYDEVFLAYPELAALPRHSALAHATLDPGQSVEGNVFWALRMSKQEWDARRDLNFTFRFQYQANLVLAPHTAVTEQ